MSMISAQCDELRERAKELRNLAPDPDVPYLVPSTKEIMALAMRSAAGEMEDAADTIWQLRDDLQRTNAENAKLRELLLDYDKMLAIAADELAYKSMVLRMDSVLNALRIRMSKLGIEVDE